MFATTCKLGNLRYSLALIRKLGNLRYIHS